MKFVRVCGFTRPDEDVLAAWEPFATYAFEHGWDVRVDWVPPWIDEEGSHEGFFQWLLWHEALCSDGRLHGFYRTLLSTPPAEFAWRHELSLADMGWRTHLEREKIVA